jgi:hypothetical protein
MTQRKYVNKGSLKPNNAGRCYYVLEYDRMNLVDLVGPDTIR